MTNEREMKIIEDSVRIIREKTDFEPEIGMILGSGLGDYADKIEDPVRISYHDIPDFPVSTVAGHAGQFVMGTCMGKKVIAMQGRVHYYEGYSQRLITLPIRIMKRLGVKKILLTNAAGGVNRAYEPGTLMIIRDHINYSGSNPLTGPNFEKDGPRFPDMSEAYDKELIRKADAIAAEKGIKVQHGIYIGTQGPTFETPAEYKLFHILGADAVGMSTVPEVIVANHCGIKVFGISVVTDLGVEGKIVDRKSVV